jgi:hypothetical protein
MTLRTALAVAAAAGLALQAAACGGSGTVLATSAAGSTPEPAARIARLTGISTAVTLDAAFVKALDTLKVTAGPTGGATLSEAGVASFPITGGSLKYFTPGTVSPFVQGRIDHAGSGLSLTAGGRRVTLTDFVVDPGRSVLTGEVAVDGRIAAPSAPLLFLDGRTLAPMRTGPNGTAVLEGTTVKLKQEAADLLDRTFGVTALKAGLVVGIARITVNAA